jgi:hypothetical protein
MARDFERWHSLDNADLEKQTVARLLDGLEIEASARMGCSSE